MSNYEMNIKNSCLMTMKWSWVLLITCLSCVKQPRQFAGKPNVTASLNDSTWFGTGTAVRVFSPTDKPNSVNQFNLMVITDMHFDGYKADYKLPPATGCMGECMITQRLSIYNIPLKKGKYKIGKVDKRRKIAIDRTNYVLLVNGSGLLKKYQFEGRNRSWIRVTRYNPESNTIEGRFSFQLDEDMQVYGRLKNNMPPVARFHHGLFSVKLIDIKLKE